MERALCPVLVGREDELSELEDALLSANRGEGQVILLAGDAGMGKTRLSIELMRRARKLGMTVVLGGCSQADLALPYLPFLEAIGNHLAAADLDEVRRKLGPVRRELAHLFPQLEPEGVPVDATDQTQGKLRLFEAVLALLNLPAVEDGLVVVIEDLHWADASTRELLDYLTRRLRSARILILGTYRRDEMHRKHPLLPLIQGWRRSSSATVIELEPLTPARVAEMVIAIFDLADGVQDDTRDFLHARTEGNPFVLEEMLKAALDRGDIFRSDTGWTRRALGEFRLPESVRDTILLRLDRFTEKQVDVLRAAAVLGYSFEYAILLEVADADPSVVQEAVETSVQQQLLVDLPGARGRYRFRHALTREAIYEDMIAPRRERLHARAAEVLGSRPGVAPIELCHHLLAGDRRSAAVPLALQAAAEAELAYAFLDAAELYEKVLSEISDRGLRSTVICQLGLAQHLAGNSAQGRDYLGEGIRLLEERRERRLAARYRLDYARCLWEVGQPLLALKEYEGARDVLEEFGPSEELALAYVRLAGMRQFAFDSEGAVAMAEKAIEVAEAVGAEMPRIWAYTFKGGGLAGLGRSEEGIEFLDRSYSEALQAGMFHIAANALYNGSVIRYVAFRGSELPLRLELFRPLPPTPTFQGYALTIEGFLAQLRGDLDTALAIFRQIVELARQVESAVRQRRGLNWIAAIFLDKGLVEDAVLALEEAGAAEEEQEKLDQAEVRLRIALRTGNLAGAAREAQATMAATRDWASGPRIAIIDRCSEAFHAAGDLDGLAEAASTVADLRPAKGHPLVDRTIARHRLAAGQVEEAVRLARDSTEFLLARGYWLQATDSRLLLAQALAAAGEVDAARESLNLLTAECADRGALGIAQAARSLAAGAGITLDPPRPAPAPPGVAATTGTASSGERFVTVLFADVRGYTAMSRAETPAEMADRIATFQRWAGAEVEKHQGVVDKFAGDALMATFNVSGAHVDHALHALRCGLALRDKAAVLDLPLGIGVATGPAVVGVLTPGANMSVVGNTTNLASRLQSQAEGGDIMLADVTYQRVIDWLREHSYEAKAEVVELKGFEHPVTARRIGQRAVV